MGGHIVKHSQSAFCLEWSYPILVHVRISSCKQTALKYLQSHFFCHTENFGCHAVVKEHIIIFLQVKQHSYVIC
jgi:hypothetical protein